MKIVKGLINTFLAFFLTIAILANFMILLLSNMILSKDYMLGLVEKNGYYEKIETDLINGFEDYKYQSGLPDEVFENLYAPSELKKDIDSIFKNIYEGTEVTNSSQNVRTKITENMNRYLTENKITLTSQMQKNVEDYQDLMVEVYENKVNSAFRYVKDANSVVMKLQKTVEIVKWIAIGGLIGILMIALLLNLKSLWLLVSVIGSSVLASGIVLELVNFTIDKNIDIDNILLFAQSFSDLLKFIMYDVLSKIHFYGILAIVLGIVGIIMGNYKRFQREES